MSDDRRRVALLVPSSNTVMENDLHRCLDKDRFTVHTARMYLEETTAAAERVMVEEAAPEAAALVGTVRPDLLVFGCTSAGSLGGLSYDREVCTRLGETAGCPAIGVLSCVQEALARRQLRRVAVVTPYIAELTRSVSESLQEQGLEVPVRGGMGIDVNVELATPTPAEVTQFTLDVVGDCDVDGIFVSCTNFRALEAAGAISSTVGVPVVTSNSAVIEAIQG